jgi:hypothetical protein
MADQVVRLLEDPDLAESLAVRARGRADEVFGVDQYHRAVVAACDRLRARGRSGQAR